MADKWQDGWFAVHKMADGLAVSPIFQTREDAERARAGQGTYLGVISTDWLRPFLTPAAPEVDWKALTAGKARPVAIYHNGDAQAYYQATEEERAAWNRYAQEEADKFNSNPRLDSYDSTMTHVGKNRDGNITSWCPPLWFPEWLEQHRKGKA